MNYGQEYMRLMLKIKITKTMESIFPDLNKPLKST